MNVDCFCFIDCRENCQRQLEEERERLRQQEFARDRAAQPNGDQNNPERGKLITVADYKNGSNHQTNWTSFL